MIARECAAQMARQIVRALHIAQPSTTVGAVAAPEAGPAKRKPAKPRKKRRAV